MSEGIFAGLKVIDCASFVAAPAAATILADFGADVIKIEPPGSGDPYRALGSFPGLAASSSNYFWMLDARSKRSLALDLKAADGRGVLCRLAAQADVFITNYPPSVRRRLGITYDTLSALNPRLIYASFSAYGEFGAEADKTGFDSTAYWARSGLMDLVRADAAAAPARSVPGMGDHPSAMALYAAITTALYRRERTGLGGHVSSSLLANGLWANACFVQAKLCGATFFERKPREQSLNALANLYRCREGRWFMLALVSEERQWPELAAAVGRPDLVDDPRFAITAERRQNAQALTAILDQEFAKRDREAWRAVLDAHGVTFGIISVLDDVVADEQIRAIEALVAIEGDGPLTVDSPFQLGGERKEPPRRAPALGEHSAEVLCEAGYTAADVAGLKARGVVG